MDNRVFDKVNDIKSSREPGWCIRAKILRVWICCLSTFGPYIRMVLCDEEGDRIQAYVENAEYARLEYLLMGENSWFVFEGFCVFDKHPFMTLTCNPYEICLIRFSTVRVLQDCLSPRHRFLIFSSITSIFEGSLLTKLPIDLIGAITWVGNLEVLTPNGRSPSPQNDHRSKVQFTIRDNRFRGLECLAYDDVAETLVEKFDREVDKHLFVTLRFFFIKTCGDKKWLRGISGASNIYYNEFYIPEFYEFFQSYGYPYPSSYNDDHKSGYFDTIIC